MCDLVCCLLCGVLSKLVSTQFEKAPFRWSLSWAYNLSSWRRSCKTDVRYKTSGFVSLWPVVREVTSEQLGRGLCCSWGPHRPGLSSRSVGSRPPRLRPSLSLLVLAAAFSGQPQAVIMTSGPLKREGMLASTVSQSNVVLTPAAIARVRRP